MPSRRLSRREVLALAASAAVAGDARPLAATPRRRPVRRPVHFVFVHGAWHGAWCWYRITTALEAAGHRATALDLPSAGIDGTPPGEVTLQTQADRVVAFLDTLSEPVVLVGHSAGGPVVSTAAEMRPQAIVKLVYVTSYLLPDGASIATVSLGDTDSHLTPYLVLNPDGTVSIAPEGRRDVFYGDCADRDVTLAQSLLKPIGVRATLDAVHVGAAFESVRRFYVTCTRDHAISPSVQRSMVERLPCERVFAIASDHSPFLSHPRELLRVLAAVARA